MPSNKKKWVYILPKAKKPQVPVDAKEQITAQCQQLIDSEFKPRYIDLNPQDNRLIITDIYGKWYRSFYYFCNKCYFNSPTLSTETIETKFTRLEYTAPDKFNLAYMRHTGQWWEIRTGISLKNALEEIKNNPILHPK
ncbi:MAG: hypothetical protein NW214_13225 [Pseudanabaenaceae cyanobacterium bins.39]|nr:hypothetical protein [Pseudanabaenaceae cyanobacterium bins.39]